MGFEVVCLSFVWGHLANIHTHRLHLCRPPAASAPSPTASQTPGRLPPGRPAIRCVTFAVPVLMQGTVQLVLTDARHT